MWKNSLSFLIILILLLNCCRNNRVKSLDNNATNGNKNIDSVLVEPEKYPKFKGGQSALLEFIDSNLNNSIVSDSNLKEGRVVISFIIDTIGKIGDFKIEKSYNQIIDSEFLRVLKLMPNWEPGEICLNNMNGPWRKISYKYLIPLKIPYHNKD